MQDNNLDKKPLDEIYKRNVAPWRWYVDFLPCIGRSGLLNHGNRKFSFFCLNFATINCSSY